jgi:putative acetyltransferase
MMHRREGYVMVILIGGASCAGKTTMAQRILEKYKIPYLSIDHIKMGLIRGNKYCDFKATDSDDALTGKLWPIVKGIILTNIENDQHIIIEGCYIPADELCHFEPNYSEHIISLYIGFSERYIKNNYLTGIIGHRSETEYKALDNIMKQDYFIRANKQQKAFCEANHAAYFEIDEDYDREIQYVYSWIDEQVGKTLCMKFND